MEIGEVSLVKDCMICHKEVIIMATKSVKKAKLPEEGSILPKVCDDCKDKYLSKGVLLINPENGRLVVLKDEAFNRIFDKPIPKGKIAFTDNKVLDLIQKGNKNGK